MACHVYIYPPATLLQDAARREFFKSSNRFSHLLVQQIPTLLCPVLHSRNIVL